MAPANTAPDRTLIQRKEALQRANEIRTLRSTLKRDLKAGKVSIIDLLLEPPAYLYSAKVFDLLLATPTYGRVKTKQVLQRCRISASKTIGGLSPRQRTELASMLPRTAAASATRAAPCHRPLTPIEARVLQASCSGPDTPVAEIADQVHISATHAYRVRRDLIAWGLLTAHAHPTVDGHATAAVLTPA